MQERGCGGGGGDFWRRRARRMTVPETAAMAVAKKLCEVKMEAMEVGWGREGEKGVVKEGVGE